jgi:hypothetical protein
MNPAAVLRRRSGERKAIGRAHRQQGGGLYGFTQQAEAADQTRSRLRTWHRLLFLELGRAPFDEVRNLIDHFFIGPGAGDFETAMPALGQIDAETACPLGYTLFCGNPQSRVCGIHHSHICGLSRFHICYFLVGSHGFGITTHICGFPSFHNWGNVGTRILPGAAALEGGYDISR